MTASDIYRACASIAVLRPKDADGLAYEVLLVHKPRKKDSWQIPQGGIEDGESLSEAALRELKEEAGITATVLKESERTYRYDFPKSYRQYRPDNVCGQTLGFVIAVAEMDQVVTVDGDEIDAYAWVLPDKIGDYLVRAEYKEIVDALVAEGIRTIQS
ncbi:MAG: NUDIX domain-containing protein [bacterium]|nr:NUDIX domain-containing protein [bacterium]